MNAYANIGQEKNALLSWAIQFIIRKRILDQLKTAEPYNIQCSIFELMHKPIFDNRRHHVFLEHYSSSVNDLNISGLHYITKDYINEGIFKFIEDNFDVLDEEKDILSDVSPYDVYNKLIEPVTDTLAHGNNPRITATIDLNINDAQIKKDFTDFLKRKREELNIKPLLPKPFKSGKIKSLIDNRVLQYLDLKILDQHINGSNTLKHHQFGNHIFPMEGLIHTGIDVTEKIRKSTIPLADEMMNEKTITSMLAEVKRRTI